MVDTKLFDSKVSESGFHKSHIAKTLGISEQALWNKKTNKTKFRVSEIYVISDLLKLDDTDKKNIFFAEGVE